jgi:hypothetical protein
MTIGRSACFQEGIKLSSNERQFVLRVAWKALLTAVRLCSSHFRGRQ